MKTLFKKYTELIFAAVFFLFAVHELSEGRYIETVLSAYVAVFSCVRHFEKNRGG